MVQRRRRAVNGWSVTVGERHLFGTPL